MRNTRVKSAGFSRPAYNHRQWFWRAGVGIAGILVVLMILVPVYQLSTAQPKSSEKSPESKHIVVTPPAFVPEVKRSRCSGVGSPDPIPLSLGPELIEINPGEECIIIHKVQVGTVEFCGYQGCFKIGTEGGMTAQNAHSVRATTGYARMLYQLCPHTEIRLKWGCKPVGFLSGLF